MARAALWSQLVNELSRRALFEDEELTRPRERRSAMRLWAPLTQLVIPSTPEATGRFADRAALLHEIGALEERLVQHGPDPWDWACQTRAYDAHDVGTTPGFSAGTEEALRAIAAPTLLLAPPLDLYNPAGASHELAREIPDAEFVAIPSDRGHRAATDSREEDAQFLNRAIGEFVAR
jgi:homoserine O-acetyltransferase